MTDFITAGNMRCWYSQDNHNNGVGIYIVPPDEISSQFPIEGRMWKDNSPSHITLCFLRDLQKEDFNKVKNIISKTCKNFKPFNAKLQAPKKLINRHLQTVYYSPIGYSGIKEFQSFIINELIKNDIEIDSIYKNFKPHITIEYVKKKKKDY